MRVPCLASWLAPFLTAGCVLSTYGGVGAPLETPPRPTLVSSAPPASPSSASGDQDPLAKIHARHILVAYRGAMRAAPEIVRSREQAHARAEEARRRAMAGEPFTKLAGEYSDDLGSAPRGGDLGAFSRQDMVAEFSEAAFALQPGEVSEIVESAFGFHVILRYDPEQEDSPGGEATPKSEPAPEDPPPSREEPAPEQPAESTSE